MANSLKHVHAICRFLSSAMTQKNYFSVTEMINIFPAYTTDPHPIDQSRHRIEMSSFPGNFDVTKGPREIEFESCRGRLPKRSFSVLFPFISLSLGSFWKCYWKVSAGYNGNFVVCFQFLIRIFNLGFGLRSDSWDKSYAWFIT